MDDRKILLKRIQICDFVMAETAMFLNTHPDNKAALEYFHKYHNMRMQAVQDFTSKYGPINHDTVTSQDRWDWIDNPWPWHKEA